MAKSRLMLLGQDLIAKKLLISSVNMLERKTFKRDKLISNDFSFDCRNDSLFFSVGNPKSIFGGANWLYTPIQYYNSDEILVWDGILTNVNNNYRSMTTSLPSKDNLYKFKENYIEYESSGWETAADAAKTIMDNYSFTYYNKAAIQESINYLTDNSAYLKCNINLSDNMNMYNALEKLAEVSTSDAYSSIGRVNFKTWKPFTGNTSISLNIDKTTRLKTAPIVSYLNNDITNDYSIDYDGAVTPMTDALGNNIGQASRTKYGTQQLTPMQTGTGKQIVFKDSTTAIFVGEQYIKRSNYNYSTNPKGITKVQFDINIKFKQYITLDSFFKLTYPNENWTNKVFETMEFHRNEDNQNINIVGFEAVI